MTQTREAKLAQRRKRDRERQQELRAERPKTHPRLARQATRDRTIKCEACHTFKRFDTDCEGHALEICLCGVGYVGS